MNLGFLIESVVSVLLLVTIGYCIMLNTRLKRLKADETALRSTIAELIGATEAAERAVAGLKNTARDCEVTLAERLRSAERLSADIERQSQVGEAVVQRLSRIVLAARPGAEGEPAGSISLEPRSADIERADPSAMAAAAQAIADRARRRMTGLAA